MSLAKEAIAKVMQLISQDEVSSLKGGKDNKVTVTVSKDGSEGGREKCPECEKGTCTDPEHMSEDDADALSKMYGDEGGDEKDDGDHEYR